MVERLFGQGVPDPITCPKCGNSTGLHHIECMKSTNKSRHQCDKCDTIWTDWQQDIIKKLYNETRRQEQIISDYEWRVNPDRMGS